MDIYIYIYALFIIGLLLTKRSRTHYAFFIGIILLFLGVFRAETVGTDISLKGPYFRNWIFSDWDPSTWNKGTPFEIGFNLYMVFLKSIWPNYHFFYGTTFLLSFCGIAYFLKKHSKDVYLSVFILYTLFVYCFMFNIVRQMFAASICLIVLHLYFLKKLKDIIFLFAIIAVSFLFHKSNMIFVIIPILKKLSDISINKIVIYLLCALSFILFINTSFLTPYILNYSYLLGERYLGYIEWGQYAQISYSTLEMLLYLSIVVITTFFHKGNKFSTLFWFFVLIILCRGAFINIFFIFARISILALLIFAVVFANVYESYSNDKKKRTLYLTLIAIMTSIVFFDALSKNYSEVIPYVNTISN